jgi:hypothetical protein
MTPVAAKTAKRGSQRKVPSRTRNSPMKPFRLGRPIEPA